MVYENALNIYTDGSSFSRPRRGGIGIRYVTIDESGNELVTDSVLPGHKGATNNEMELLACVKALEEACTHEKIYAVERVVIFTDSRYVVDNVPRAIFQWSKQKWLNRDGRPIENADLWRDLLRVQRKVPRRVEYKWVQGHSKNAHNKVADKLAKQSAKGVLNQPLKVSTVRRKITSLAVEIGSVKMQGQELAIRIITDTYMKRQKLYKYKYEVLTESSPYRGKVDLIYSELLLRAGHHYQVQLNNNTLNPRILEVIAEIQRDAPRTEQ